MLYVAKPKKKGGRERQRNPAYLLQAAERSVEFHMWNILFLSGVCVCQTEQSEKLMVRNYDSEFCACISVLIPSWFAESEQHYFSAVAEN